MTYQSASGYAGDLLAPNAFELLAGDPTSTLIDVRTQAEWTYVGACRLTVALPHGFRPCWRQADSSGARPCCSSADRASGTPCRNRYNGRRLGAVFQCLGRVRRPFGLIASQERRWRLESGGTALDADLDGLARVRFACRRCFH